MDGEARMRDDGLPYVETSAQAQAIVASGELPDDATVDAINIVPDEFRGLDRYAARDLVIEQITAEGLAIMVPETDPRLGPGQGHRWRRKKVGKSARSCRWLEAKTITQPFGDRSGVVIEPMLTDQWFCDAETLAKPAIASVREGRTKFVPATWEKTYYHWMENIQPWCISRQLWWGHRIPAWYGPDGQVFVAKTEEIALEQAARHYGADTVLERDEDVLDTWFSSALWPFSTMGWPENTDELAKYYPTSVLSTAFDIIFFWVARMMMMGLHFTDREPFHTVYMHPLVLDRNGAKMSKSKGNGVDPLDLIEEFSADALRFTLASQAVQGRDVRLDPARVEGYRNFTTKLWNATRFAEMNNAAHGGDLPDAELPLNRWVLTELAQAEADVTAALGAYRFNDAAGAAYRFTWNTVCDWYLELAKPTLNGADAAAADEVRRTTGYVLDRIYALLHPFMPFVTEELWGATAQRERLLCHTPWSVELPRDTKAAAELNWLVDTVTAVRSVRAEMGLKPSAKLTLVTLDRDAEMQARIERHRDVLLRLARLEAVETHDAAPDGSVQILVGTQAWFLPLGGHVDLATESARLKQGRGRSREGHSSDRGQARQREVHGEGAPKRWWHRTAIGWRKRASGEMKSLSRWNG